MKALILFLLLTQMAFAKVESDISGNVEAQGRHAWNNSAAQTDPLLQQKWKEKDFYLMYGNLNGKFDFGGSRLEANWFVRHSTSDLYRKDYFATRIYTFPNRLVARDVFQLQYHHQQDNYFTESVINKLFYEWDYGEHKFVFGRMYINYGQGEVFNPINPFNQPTGLTSISQVAQGNDGFQFKFYMHENHTVEFYLLGDKRIEGYNGQINRTLWAHGEIQATEKLQLDYVIGEDQKRDKVGGQASYRFEEAMAFIQGLYQSAYVNNDNPSTNLLDIMSGYDEQLTNKWHLRIEGGYQKKNPYATIQTFDRFLPTEYFVAIANQYEIHPLVKLNGTVINDIKSGFTYFIAKSTFDLGHNMEMDVFGYLPVAKGKTSKALGPNNTPDFISTAQKLVTTDIGMALRAFF